MATTDDQKILKAAAEGHPVREIARAHGIPEAQVRDILDREAEAWFDATHLAANCCLR